jgi:hypothetical protein
MSAVVTLMGGMASTLAYSKSIAWSESLLFMGIFWFLLMGKMMRQSIIKECVIQR